MSMADTATSGRRAGHEVRRRRILDAAATLFEAKGFEGTTTDDIAESAEVTKRTLYRYVGSKEALLYEIHEDFMSELLEEVTSSSGSAEERFRAMVDAHIRDLAAHLRDIKVFFEEIKHLGSGKRTELVTRREAYEEMVNAILSDGITDGSFRDVHVRSTTRVILGAMNEGYRWFGNDPQRVPQDVARQVSDLFLHGLIAERRPTWSPDDPTEQLARVSGVADKSGDQPIDRILDSATKLFSASGYHRTSTQQIADAAGVTKGALFYYVSYKEEALQQIHSRLFDRMAEVLSGLDAPEVSAITLLQRLIAAQVGFIMHFRDAIAVVSEEMKYLPDDTIADFVARQSSFQNMLEEVIARGVASNELMCESPRLISLVIAGMLNSIYRWYRSDAALTPSELAQDLSELVLLGLSTDS
jgi:AcrR family transcriptional regulator